MSFIGKLFGSKKSVVAPSPSGDKLKEHLVKEIPIIDNKVKTRNPHDIEKDAKTKEPFSDAVTELLALYNEKTSYKDWSPVVHPDTLRGRKDALFIIKKYVDGSESIDSIKSFYEHDKKYCNEEFNRARLDMLAWAVNRLNL